MLKKIFITLLIISLCLVAGYHLSRKASSGDPLQSDPYIIIYGRTDCSICQDYRQRLDSQEIAYTFKDIGDVSVQNELYPRMKKAGLNSNYFPIPVIDVNGKLTIRPDLRNVINNYHQPIPKCERKQGQRFCEWVSKIDPKRLVKRKLAKDPLQIAGINTIGGELCAVIGENIVRKGDKIGENKVMEIKQDSVEFRNANGKIVIKKYG